MRKVKRSRLRETATSRFAMRSDHSEDSDEEQSASSRAAAVLEDDLRCFMIRSASFWTIELAMFYSR